VPDQIKGGVLNMRSPEDRAHGGAPQVEPLRFVAASAAPSSTRYEHSTSTGSQPGRDARPVRQISLLSRLMYDQSVVSWRDFCAPWCLCARGVFADLVCPLISNSKEVSNPVSSSTELSFDKSKLMISKRIR
jgi:hypothetical protein